LIDLGAVLASSELKDARLETVAPAGVAPDDFYATTIYPRKSDSMVAGSGERQRMTP